MLNKKNIVPDYKTSDFKKNLTAKFLAKSSSLYCETRYYDYSYLNSDGGVTFVRTSFQICGSKPLHYIPTADDGGADNGDYGGGSFDYPEPAVKEEMDCEDAKIPSEIATNISKGTKYTVAKSAIIGMNNGVENGVVFGNVNGNLEITGVQTGGSSSIENLTSSFSDPVADLHNHPNSNPPSPGDFYSLINARNKHSNYNTRYVITQDGTTYALIVTDPSAMNIFLQNYPPSIILDANGKHVNFPSSIFNEWYDLTASFSEAGALAHILNKYNSGIALTKMDSAGNFRAINITKIQNPDGSITPKYNLCPN